MSSVTGAAGQFAGMTTSLDERVGAGLGKSVSAWHRVFEREQLAALAEFRSVSAGRPVGPGAYDAYSVSPMQAHRALPVATAHLLARGRADWAGRESADASTARPAVDGHFFNAAKSPMPAGDRWTAVWRSQPPLGTPMAKAGQALPGPAALHRAALASSGEWPWRKLHCMADANGVHVWLRDTAIGAHDSALHQLIAKLRQALEQSGARLASFTLNGTAISPIA